MILEIEAFTLDEALDYLKNENPDLNISNPIKLTSSKIDLKKYESLELLFYKILKEASKNENKIHSSVDIFINRGTKEWVTKYLILDFRSNVINTSKKLLTKEQAIDSARRFTSENLVDTKIIIGKELLNSNRTQANIMYKSSQNQIPAVYVFVF